MWICAAALLALVVRSAAALGASPRRLLAIAVALGLFPLALGSVVLTRYDLWPAALAAGALAALLVGPCAARAGRARRSPSPRSSTRSCSCRSRSLYVARRHGRREALLGLGVFAAVLAVDRPPVRAPRPRRARGTASTRQLGRPLQIESLGASLLLAAHQLGLYEPTVVSSHGSQNLAGVAPRRSRDRADRAPGGRARRCLGRSSPAAPRRPARLVAACAGVGRRLRRLREGALAAVPDLARAARAARRAGGSGWPRPALLGAALVSTHLWFPSRYWDIVALEPVGWLVARPQRPPRRAVGRARRRYGTGTRSALAARSAPVGAALDDDALDAHVALGRVEPHRHPGAHPLDRELGADADHRVVRAGHARVGDRGRAAGEDAGVVRLHVRVRPDHGGHPAVEHARQRDLLARRLGVEVDEDDRRLRARLLDERVHDPERVHRRLEEELALEVQDRDRRPVARLGVRRGRCPGMPASPKFAGRSDRGRTRGWGRGRGGARRGSRS